MTANERELARKRNARYRAAHPERLRAVSKKRRDATREQRRAYNDAYRATHKEEARLYRASKNPAEVRAYMKAYNESNRDRLIQQKKAYHAVNKEQANALAKAYYETHKEDWRRYSQIHRERIAKHTAARKAANRGHYTALQQKREAAIRRALPVWANLEAMEAMYKAARRLTLETGIQYDVDHVIPLSGKNVCGLHVENNLQIITHAENIRKHNTFPFARTA